MSTGETLTRSDSDHPSSLHPPSSSLLPPSSSPSSSVSVSASSSSLPSLTNSSESLQSIVTDFTYDESGLLSCHGDKYALRVIVRHASLRLLAVHLPSSALFSGSFSSQYIEEMTERTGSYKSFALFCRFLISSLRSSSTNVFLDLLTFEDLEKLKIRRQKEKERKNKEEQSGNAEEKEGENKDLQQGNEEKKEGPSSASNEGEKGNIDASKAAANQNKRYVILTYVAEFEKVHYPLPIRLDSAFQRKTASKPHRDRPPSETIINNNDNNNNNNNNNDHSLMRDTIAKLQEENRRLREKLHRTTTAPRTPSNSTPSSNEFELKESLARQQSENERMKIRLSDLTRQLSETRSLFEAAKTANHRLDLEENRRFLQSEDESRRERDLLKKERDRLKALVEDSKVAQRRAEEGERKERKRGEKREKAIQRIKEIIERMKRGGRDGGIRDGIEKIFSWLQRRLKEEEEEKREDMANVGRYSPYNPPPPPRRESPIGRPWSGPPRSRSRSNSPYLRSNSRGSSRAASPSNYSSTGSLHSQSSYNYNRDRADWRTGLRGRSRSGSRERLNRTPSADRFPSNSRSRSKSPSLTANRSAPSLGPKGSRSRTPSPGARFDPSAYIQMKKDREDEKKAARDRLIREKIALTNSSKSLHALEGPPSRSRSRPISANAHKEKKAFITETEDNSNEPDVYSVEESPLIATKSPPRTAGGAYDSFDHSVAEEEKKLDAQLANLQNLLKEQKARMHQNGAVSLASP